MDAKKQRTKLLTLRCVKKTNEINARNTGKACKSSGKRGAGKWSSKLPPSTASGRGLRAEPPASEEESSQASAENLARIGPAWSSGPPQKRKAGEKL
jgi:hypothetical protein